IYIDVDPEESLWRILGRAGQEGRSDDQEATIRHRLDVFETQTKPLVKYYEDRGLLIRIDGKQPVDKVTEELLQQLSLRK
ncbi:MAG TPA: nucleoside monophosphate kinase, partial [Acidimicrobiales bacterium]|nr:nucleoside monophosphate kinase [Acidimicrobiales bacterium]